MSVVSQGALTSAARTKARADDARLRLVVREYYDFVWRTLRRMGVPDDAAEDAAQQVFLVLSHKLDAVPASAERSFLFGTAVRVASGARRTQQRRREVSGAMDAEPADESPSAEAMVDEKKARAMLDAILQSMPEELRSVFVLCAIEELSAPEAAQLLNIPVGTVSSRLRRGRELFHAAANRLKARRGTL